jgi:hypothetical protein
MYEFERFPTSSIARRKGFTMLLAVNARLAWIRLVLGFLDGAKMEIFNCGISELCEGVFADMTEAFVPIGKREFLWCNACK